MESLELSYEVIKKIKDIKEAFHQLMTSQLKTLNVTAPQGMILGILAKNGPQTMSALSDKMGLSKSTVSAIVDRLEKAGHVKREKSPTDGRVVFVRLKDAFKEKNQCQFETLEKIWVERIAKATHEEIHMVMSGLNVLEKLIKGDAND